MSARRPIAESAPFPGSEPRIVPDDSRFRQSSMNGNTPRPASGRLQSWTHTPLHTRFADGHHNSRRQAVNSVCCSQICGIKGIGSNSVVRHDGMPCLPTCVSIPLRTLNREPPETNNWRFLPSRARPSRRTRGASGSGASCRQTNAPKWQWSKVSNVAGQHQSPPAGRKVPPIDLNRIARLDSAWAICGFGDLGRFPRLICGRPFRTRYLPTCD